jgi:energy-converting hydrogenase Eha subunit F
MYLHRPTRTIRLVAAALAVVAVSACSPEDTAAEARTERGPAPSVELESDRPAATYDCQRVRSGSYC